MKIRSVRPEFFSDPTMADLEPHARLLYIGLWCYVDDEGRGEWLPKQIDGQIFPLEDVDVCALLAQLVRTARIIRYSDGDREFFYIPKFSDYQKPNRKYESKLPDPADCTVSTGSETPAVREQRVRSVPAPPGEGEGEGEGEGVIAPRARNEIWDTLVEIYGDPSPSSRSLYGRISSWLRSRDATPDEIRRRSGLLIEEWGRKAATPASLEKHWTRYDSQIAAVSESDVDEFRVSQERERRRLELHQIQAERDEQRALEA